MLDLSKVEDSVASLFQQGDEERGVTVTYREATDMQGETTYSVDVDVPNDLDVDLDLEVDLPESAGKSCICIFPVLTRSHAFVCPFAGLLDSPVNRASRVVA